MDHLFRGTGSGVKLHTWGLLGGYFFLKALSKFPGSLSFLWSFSQWPELARPKAIFLGGVHNRPGVHSLVVGGICSQGRGIQARFVRDWAHGQAAWHGGTIAPRVVHDLFIGFEVHFVGLMVVVAVVVLLLGGHEVVDREGVVEGVMVLWLQVGLRW